MTSKYLEFSKNMNYSFLLKCMAGLAAAAVVTAGILAVIAFKTAVVTAPLLLATTAVVATPLLPIAGLLLFIGAVCCLPFCFGRRSTAAIGSNYNPGFYSPHYHGHSYLPEAYQDSHYHGHDYSTSGGGMHGHHGHDSFPSGGNVHGHDTHVSSSHQHGHF